MAALAVKMRGRYALGRALGYRDGAYVGQMILGQRPITEKTIAKAEALKGPNGERFRGWFSMDAANNEVGAVYDEPTDEEWEFLENFRHMHDHDRVELAAEVARRAARAKADIDAYIKRFGLTPRPASASLKAATAAQTDVEPPSQKELALEESGKKRLNSDAKEKKP